MKVWLTPAAPAVTRTREFPKVSVSAFGPETVAWAAVEDTAALEQPAKSAPTASSPNLRSIGPKIAGRPPCGPSSADSYLKGQGGSLPAHRTPDPLELPEQLIDRTL